MKKSEHGSNRELRGWMGANYQLFVCIRCGAKLDPDEASHTFGTNGPYCYRCRKLLNHV